ncbi:MAG: hypothetical protein KAJ14_11390 [Candidatus Omnitrophica bacterium]|nr:hypothetical protein [Candidatus Omnitrophota bacterium]MCK5287420.1 hypothetical protein [Candidatus Omnitrophota bacterium]MCK5392820.1 hypothetical protein [Candidatus Omnitrophota bacterium]MCK5493702.1 hypothetical protein [Candidatus Omnitrophota bacterium]
MKSPSLKKYIKFNHQPFDFIRKKQFLKIKETVSYAYNNSKFYRRLYDNAKLSPDKIKEFSDFEKLPLVRRKDLHKYNWDIPAVSKDKWIDISTTSGTTARPIYLPWTKKDFLRLAQITYILHGLAGIRKKDLVQITYPLGMGMWIAGLHNWLGLYKKESCSLRFGPGFTESQLHNMEKLRPDVLLGSPSFLFKLGAYAKDRKMQKKIKPRLICVSGENIVNHDFKFNDLGVKLEKVWEGSDIRPVYGASEGPICGVVCNKGQGYHIPAQFFYLEVLDIKTHNIVKPGNRGVLAITVFDAQAFPLIRYVLGDITSSFEGPCQCGWNSLRLGPILGRVDRLLKVKGVLINLEDIRSLVLKNKDVEIAYLEIIKDDNLIDQVVVYISFNNKFDNFNRKRVKDDIKFKIKSKFRINTKIFVKSNEKLLKKVWFTEKNERRRKPVYIFDDRGAGWQNK